MTPTRPRSTHCTANSHFRAGNAQKRTKEASPGSASHFPSCSLLLHASKRAEPDETGETLEATGQLGAQPYQYRSSGSGGSRIRELVVSWRRMTQRTEVHVGLRSWLRNPIPDASAVCERRGNRVVTVAPSFAPLSHDLGERPRHTTRGICGVQRRDQETGAGSRVGSLSSCRRLIVDQKAGP